MEVSNVFGIFVVPIGVLLCFGPALAVWLLAETEKESSERPEDRKDQSIR
jgi:hypothetical protein